MNSPSVFVSVQAVSRESLSNRTFEQVGGARIRVPLDLNLTVNDSENIFVRVSLSTMFFDILCFCIIVNHATTCFTR